MTSSIQRLLGCVVLGAASLQAPGASRPTLQVAEPQAVTQPLQASAAGVLKGQLLFSAVPKQLAALKNPKQIDTLHGQQVADPFRALEDLDAPATAKFAKTQTARTNRHLKSEQAARTEAIQWHREMWNYDRESMPYVYGQNSFYTRREGLASQPLYMVQENGGTPRVLIDPNTLSKDGTVAVGTTSPSPDGKQMAYLVNDAGSDMETLYIRDVATGKDLPDVLTGLRFSCASWDNDGQGIVYGMPVDAQGKPDPKGIRIALFHHRLGEEQSKDTPLFDRPDVATSGAWAFRLKSGDTMQFIQLTEGTDPFNGLYFKNDGDAGAFKEILPLGKAGLSPIHREGNTLYAVTTLDAPRSRIVAIDLTQPDTANWKTVIPESTDESQKLESGFVMGQNLFVAQKNGGADEILRYTLDGKLEGKIPTPLGVTIALGDIQPNAKDFLLTCSGYLSPATRYRYDITTGTLDMVQKSAIKRDLTQTAKVERLFATSKDGTKIPMWVISPKDLKKDGSSAAMLYGYGGFNVSLEPGFSFNTAHWVENGGVWVVANLRGGGEFGQSWYDGGRLKNKQNVFDDFAACAQELVKQGYTTNKRLAISGGSNGGLLTAATMLQNPSLFGAVISAVPVTDMLRFHLAGMGSAWISDYGDPNKKDDFETAIKYSPVHNVKSAKGQKYPPTLITTGDHDDRVAPWHAYKLAATLQDQGHKNTYLRVDTRAGHGAGKPTDKVIEELADEYAFLVKALGPLKPAP